MIGLVARSENKVIGKNGKLPWHCSEDLKFFKRMTMGKSLLMGAQTYIGLPKILNRRIMVLYSRVDTDLIDKWFHDRELKMDVCFVDAVTTGGVVSGNLLVPSSDVVLCGGGKTYSRFMGWCDEIYVSVIKGDYEGDTFFDDTWLNGFEFASNMEVSDQLLIQKYNRISLKKARNL